MLVYMVLHLLVSLAALPRTDARDFIGKNTKKPLHNKTSRPHFSNKNRPLNQFNRSDRPSLPTAYPLYKHPLKFNHSQLFTIIQAKMFVFNVLIPLFKLFTLGGILRLNNSPGEKMAPSNNGCTRT